MRNNSVALPESSLGTRILRYVCSLLVSAEHSLRSGFGGSSCQFQRNETGSECFHHGFSIDPQNRAIRQRGGRTHAQSLARNRTFTEELSLTYYSMPIVASWLAFETTVSLPLANSYRGSETIGSAKRAATIIRTQTPYDFIGCLCRR